MTDMLPLLIVALLVWAGVFAFIFSVDRKISDIEKRINDRSRTNIKENDL
jgi:CcmD family protein